MRPPIAALQIFDGFNRTAAYPRFGLWSIDFSSLYFSVFGDGTPSSGFDFGIFDL